VGAVAPLVAAAPVNSLANERGPPPNYDRIGDPVRGWPLHWSDAWDAAVQTGMTVAVLGARLGARMHVWYRGYWWDATIWAVAPRRGTVTVRWMHTQQLTSGYRPSLIRQPPPGL